MTRRLFQNLRRGTRGQKMKMMVKNWPRKSVLNSTLNVRLSRRKDLKMFLNLWYQQNWKTFQKRRKILENVSRNVNFCEMPFKETVVNSFCKVLLYEKVNSL